MRASGPVGPVVNVIGGTKDRHRGYSEGGSDVHGAAIVGEEESAGGSLAEKLFQRGSAGVVVRLESAAGQVLAHIFAE